MSRSKRAPYWTDGYGSKVKRISKRAANRTIRNTPDDKEVPQGSGYKKMFNPWSICDYKIHDPKNKKVRRK